jgi:chromosome segregation ATPase
MAEPAKKAAAKRPHAGDTKPKATRKVLTFEEKVARAEAELASLRDKAAKKATEQRDKLTEERGKLVAKRDELNLKIGAIDQELVTVGGGDTPDGDPIVDGQEIAASVKDDGKS